MSDAGVMTVAIVAARYFDGIFERAHLLFNSLHYIPRMLSNSQFNSRLHAVHGLLLMAFGILGENFKQLNISSLYIINSFRVAACDNIRIRLNKRFCSGKFRGYTASRHRYFYRIKIFLLTAAKCEPVEMSLILGPTFSAVALDVFGFDLLKMSTVYIDSAFTRYVVEGLLRETDEIALSLMHKNSRRAASASLAYLQTVRHKQVETVGSLIEGLLLKGIHAVTAKGFTLKVFLFVLAYRLS